MKQFKNVVYVEGYVFNASLFERETGPNSKVPGQEYINGIVNIATDEDCINIVPVRYTFVVPTWKTGKENETYTILKSLLNGAPTVEKDGKDKATKLRIQGDVEVNDFMGRDGNMVETKQVRGGFTHYANDGFRDKRNNFETDMAITNVRHIEVENGDDYTNVDGYVFNFRGDLIPVTYTITNPAGMAYFESLDVSINQPELKYIWGKIVSTTQKIEREVETAWGAPQIEYTTRTLRMWSIDGASPESYPWDDESTITVAEFKQGLANREQQKAEAKARADAKNNQNNAFNNADLPFAGGTTTPTSPTSATNFKF